MTNAAKKNCAVVIFSLCIASACSSPRAPSDTNNEPNPSWNAERLAVRDGRPSCLRALSIDGGGVRGIIPAVLLEELEKRLDRPIYSYFDLIAGTSTGALVTLALTTPQDKNRSSPLMTAGELVRFYRKHAADVFVPRHGFFTPQPKYASAPVEDLLRQEFGDARLHDALTRVLIVALVGEDRGLFFFDSGASSPVFRVRDVALGATAAPTYFAPHRIRVPKDFRERGYITVVDAGLVANNPASHALSHLTSGRENEKALLVSIGTGSGGAEWWKLTMARKLGLLDVQDADAESERIASELRRTDYFRLQPQLTDLSGAMNNSLDGNMAKLETIARTYAWRNADLLDEIAAELKQSRVCARSPDVIEPDKLSGLH